MSEEKNKKMSECINCGMCISNCPSFKATKNELFSPRGRVNMVNNESEDESFKVCTLCKTCEHNCPLNIELDFRKVREKVKPSKNDEKMIKNIRKYGNPFGELAKGEVPEDLYCC